MGTFKKTISFLFANRRTIGSIVGATLVLLGYASEGALVSEFSERL